MSLFFGLLTSRLGGWIVGGLAVLAVLGLLKIEHGWRLDVEKERDTAKIAAGISQQQLLLYQDREEIKAKANKKRGNLNEWEKKGDLDSLADDFNVPIGVRRKVPANPPGGVKEPARYHDPADPGTQYQETPGH